MNRLYLCGAAAVVAIIAGALTVPLLAQDVDARVLQAEQKRIAAIEKVRSAVVAVFARGGQGGGSGVLIDKDGYALTNYHVVQPAGPVMKCGLADGILYDAVLVGLDRVGDVALIKLLPRDGKPFPFAVLGDSDKVKPGDSSLAMGNPFLLATDFTPTVTFGIISGVHRYQYPEGRGLLEYADCIQIDTSINPGNSGGPLFNMDGELIGINGRGSFDKRGRVNSGVGYAISINQIKNFMGHLRAGLDSDHATLGATVETDREDELGYRMVVRGILDNCDARRRGLELGDEMIEFAGRPITSVNHFKNVVGIYPKGWRLPMTYRHGNDRRETLVRLMGYLAKEIDEEGRPIEGQPQPKPQPQPMPGPQIKPAPPQPPSGPAAKLYEPKPGFANFYFNKQERDRLLAAFKKHGDFSEFKGGEIAFEGTADLPRKKGAVLKASIKEDKGKPIVRLDLDGIDYDLEPLKQGIELRQLKQPTGSGGLMTALYAYRQLLTLLDKGFGGHAAHGGNEPCYPPPRDGKAPKRLGDLRVDCEVLTTEEADVTAKWYFARQDGSLIGLEVWIERHEDPCEVYFYDYQDVNGRKLPHRMEVRNGNDRFGTFTIKEYKLAKAN
jgi:S1-C subfamily serine protease